MAVNEAFALTFKSQEVGVTVTEVRVVAPERVMVIGTLVLWVVTPLSEAFTDRERVPVALPAVNVTGLPVAELRVPKEGFESTHAYVIPEGHPPPVQVGVAVNGGVVPPVPIFAACGDMETPDKVGVDVIVMGTPVLCWVTELSDALTNNVTVPVTAPAVTWVVVPVSEVTVPRLFVRVHEKVAPEGQLPPLQAGVAVKGAVVVPTPTAADTGEMETEASVGGDDTMVMGTPALCCVIAFSVALTKSVSVPGFGPAVNCVEEPVAALRAPSPLERVQEYVVPEGQGPPLHAGTAVKGDVVPPTPIVAELGERETEASVAVEVMVMAAPELCWVTEFKVALTKRVSVPAFGPAVNCVETPVAEVRVPRPLVNVQA